MSRSATMHARLGAITDLTELETISDDLLVATIRERFMTDTVYTNIGPNVLVALNPHKYVPSNSDSFLQKYAAEYRDTSPLKERLPPHVFQQANNAYYNMRRTSQDQSIIFSGEVGSGKSENRRLAIKSILELSVSNPGKKGSKLGGQIPASEFVLEAFGNAKTLFNANASRFGKYTELQFSERGRVCGVKTLDYYLERNRVAAVPSGERNFHIFYYLVAGASPEERQHLHILDKTVFRYLPQRAPMKAGRDDDGARFDQLKTALKSIGFSKRHVAQTCQLVATIMHLGNLEFISERSRNEDAAVVRNVDLLELVADFLGVQPAALETAMSYRTKLVKSELCTIFLDPDGASDNRDDLAKTLYSLLFGWLNEHINERLCNEDFSTFIGLFDTPGPQNMTSRPNSLDQFCVNFANERLQNWIQTKMFESHVQEYPHILKVPHFDNSECIRLLQNQPGGLIHIMDDQARRAPKKTNHSMSGGTDRTGFPTFTVSHYNGPVTYSSDSFIERNMDAINPDFVSLLRGSVDGVEYPGSSNPFIKGLFSGNAIATQAHPRNEDTIVAATQNVKPMRAPSTRRKGTVRRGARDAKTMPGIDEQEKEDDDANPLPSTGGPACVAGEYRAALDTLFKTLDETQSWFVFCINPNDSQLPNQLEGRSVKGQVRSLSLPEIARRNQTVFEVNMSPEEFCDRYRSGLTKSGVQMGPERDQVEKAKAIYDLQDDDIVIGRSKVFLSNAAFHRFEDELRANDTEEQKRNRLRDAEAEAGLDVRGLSDPYAPYQSPNADGDPWTPGPEGSEQVARPLVAHTSPFQRADMYEDDYDESKSLRSEDYAGSRFTDIRDDTSHFGSESVYAPSRNMFQNADKKGLPDKEPLPGEIQEGETTEVMTESSARRRWVALCWILTWWVPGPCLTWVGRMKRPDVRQAWREKLALNLIIWFICGCAVIVIAVLPRLICPTQHVFNEQELKSHSFDNDASSVYTAVRGEVFDLTKLSQMHSRTVSIIDSKAILKYGGKTADDIFPVQVSALCNGITGSVDPYVIMNSANTTDDNAQYHDFRAFTNDVRPDWYWQSMVRMRYMSRLGFVGYTPKKIKAMAASGRLVGVYKSLIYDLTDYVRNPPTLKTPDGTQADPKTATQFIHSKVIDTVNNAFGGDMTKALDSLDLDSTTLARQKVCLRNLFTIGKVDNRESPQCLFSSYILLALSIMMVSIIAFKFLASVSFSAPRAPEDHDKFVICQVPCYTEGESSLRRTIDSLAQTKYDDKRKLLFIICDGMVVGSGNDRPTPRIVLDILGADPNLDPEPLSFVSLGEGTKQHNMGKVYSGLYECSGHVVPYLVVVKVGKPTERSRPGNRGKRDSQMVLFHFLNKVHFNSPMNPLELEMYHQIKNVIGVNPTFYEYLFVIDADTTVDKFSVNRLISAMIHDKKLLAVCGETELANSKRSIITMMQVYEYFISHHMAKAFESLFGSVTCLPGCFTLYRLRTPDSHKPLLIANQMVHDYQENRVDTLHMKNLLHLGEDRYLTTLLLKHFPLFKTQFVRDAHADWKVLLSQRRRWINSTVHNLGELVWLDQLCGFCCFSMRFIVMLDLVSTLIQPVTVAYIVYLIYLIVGTDDNVPFISLVLIAAVYALQALVFVLRRKWDMIGWMVFYILAIPVFSFFLPLYSFWKMDDFSWGATRIVMGESGKKIVVHDEGKFDPRAIPLKSWNDYENELWDKESNHSIGSWVPPSKKGGYAETAPSLYGHETTYDPRPYSPAPSQGGFMPPAYYAASGRNTPQSQLRPMMGDNMSLYQPAPARPGTNYLGDVQLPGSRSPDSGYMASGGMPTDAELITGVHQILQGADLNSVTKREIRRQLEARFNTDLTSRKAVINSAIDSILLGQA
ncbi:glycosyltransferase family 2 protein [Flagelloscypha sp. PMI_526]|nr:glycosyltransferase family 2 protein [Flagelloscypha sp. PMI_526]